MSALSICVIGGGPLAELAALSLRAALPGGKVTLVNTEVGADDMADLGNVADGQLRSLHGQFSLSSDQFAQHCRAVTCAGVELHCGGEAGLTGFALGGELPFVDGVALHHLAIRAAGEGRFALDPDWNRAALQWAVRRDQQDEAASFAFDTRAWLNLMRQASGQLGIERLAARKIEAFGGGDGLASIRLDDGAELKADLYVDAAGAGAKLRSELHKAQEREDWSGWMSPWQAAGFGALPQAISGLSFRLEGDTLQCAAGPVGAQFVRAEGARRAGFWHEPWAGNLVAIGDAALVSSPLGNVALASGIADIARLLANLPASVQDRSTRAEYNRLARRHYGWLGDWIAALQMLLEGGEREWPAGLAGVLENFDRRGRIALRDGDPVAQGSWLNLLMARGVAPERVDPVAQALDEAAFSAAMARF